MIVVIITHYIVAIRHLRMEEGFGFLSISALRLMEKERLETPQPLRQSLAQ